jgi:hypothetical protein
MKSGQVTAVFTVLLQLGIYSPVVAQATPGSDSSNATAPSKVNDPEWNQKMQKLYSALTLLMVDLSSDTRFKDQKNNSKIQQNIKELTSQAHQLKQGPNQEKINDPSMLIFSENLSINLEQASSAFESGHREYARSMLLQISGACLTCHNRNNSGPQFGELPFDIQKVGLKPVEMGEFYAATRQFDRALEHFTKLISGGTAAAIAPWDWQRAVEQAMSIAIRVKRDPNSAEGIIQSAMTSNLGPKSFQQDLQQWKKSVAEWKQEKTKPDSSNWTENKLYSTGKSLIEKAQRVQKYPLDRSADVLFLRGSSYLHDLLEQFPKSPHLAQAMMYLGQAYEVLDPRPTDYLHKSFYEACVRRAPHTPVAMNCYRRYEQSTFFGFSGSSGTHLPQDIRDKLIELWGKAMPLEPKGVPKKKL